MSKIIIVILFSSVVMSSGFPQVQEAESELAGKTQSEEENDKYEAESRRDYDKSSEKGLEFLLQAQKLKEDDYRRALESILPAKDSEGYRRFFEELINSTVEKSKLDAREKKVEEVVVTDTFLDEGKSGDNGEFDPQVEEIEVVIEHITNDNNTETAKSDDEILKESSEFSPNENDSYIESEIKSQNDPTYTSNEHINIVNTKGRTGLDFSRSAESEPLQFADRRVLEPYPLKRISEVVIPHYRTTLTRSGVVVSPAVFTVQTSAPIIDTVHTDNWPPSRRISSDDNSRAGSKIGRPSDAKLIDDYMDYGSNAYSYSPSQMLAASRQTESKMNILTKLAEGPYLPQRLNQIRENYYHGRFLPRSQPFFRPAFI